MLAIRGVYNGKTLRVMPCDSMPRVDREVPVAIVFLEEIRLEEDRCRHQVEVAMRMRAARDAMTSLGVSVKALVEEGRER